MKIIKVADLANNNEEFNLKKLYNNTNIEISHFVIKIGEVLEQALFPVDTIYYIIKGKAIVECNDKRHVVAEQSLIQHESGAEIGFINAGESELEVLFIKLKK